MFAGNTQADPASPGGHWIVVLATSAPASGMPLLEALALVWLLALPLFELLPGPLLDLEACELLLLFPPSVPVPVELLLEQ